MPSNPTPDDELSNNAPDRGVPVESAPADVPVQNDELAELRAELAALRKREEDRAYAEAVAAGQPIEQRNTHVLVLANGDTVESALASVTHVDVDNGDGTSTVLPVVSRYEITRS